MKIQALVAACFAFAAPLCVCAEHHENSLFQSAFFSQFGDTTGKAVSLAEAFPEAKYSWEPAEGIRSVREVLLHIAGANYFFGSLLGDKIPEGVNPRELEKTIQGKPATVAALKESIDFVKGAVERVSEEDMATKVNMFGSEVPKMRVVILIGAHADEHLGQLIAYARSSDVVPPWSK